jgi:DNA-binding CsgD family transcriptional regulator
MASTSNTDEELFTEAENYWHTEKLYAGIASAKGKGLTKLEKTLLRGLLCGYSPGEIAKQLGIEDTTVRKYLSDGLYRYIEELLIRPVKDSLRVNWNRIPQLLEQAGYKKWKAGAMIEEYEEYGRDAINRLSRDAGIYLGYKQDRPRQDWDCAPDVSIFYGREEELATLQQWIVGDKCRLVAILGMGGIGKTALSVKLAKQIAGEFECVIWRSLRYCPPVEKIVADLLQCLCPEAAGNLPAHPESGIYRLMDCLKKRRCLVILDDYETVLRSGALAGDCEPGYEGYGELLNRAGETLHESCLLIASQEKPKEIAAQEGKTLPVRSFKLEGLKAGEAQEILRAKGLYDENAWGDMINLYRGNPLALKIISATILELFDGKVAHFLKQNTMVLSKIQGILEQQFERLSELEIEILRRLAIQPASPAQLRERILPPVSTSPILEALESLGWRSLIETVTEEGERLHTLQPVVMKYVNKRYPRTNS